VRTASAGALFANSAVCCTLSLSPARLPACIAQICQAAPSHRRVILPLPLACPVLSALPALLQEASYSSLSALLGSALASPNTPLQRSSAGPAPTSVGAPAPLNGYASGAATATATAAGLLGMHSGSNGGGYGVASPAANHGHYSGPAGFGSGAGGFSSGGGNGYGFGPIGGYNTSSAHTAAPTGVDANTLAALAASPAQPPGPSASLAPLTAKGLTCNAAGLGVVGPPTGLAPIGTAAGLPQPQLAAAQQLPSPPATPVGTATTGAVAAMRRSISGRWHVTHTLSPPAAAMQLACCLAAICCAKPFSSLAISWPRLFALPSASVAPTTPRCPPPSLPWLPQTRMHPPPTALPSACPYLSASSLRIACWVLRMAAATTARHLPTTACKRLPQPLTAVQAAAAASSSTARPPRNAWWRRRRQSADVVPRLIQCAFQ
jgi:hypothetical protein